MEKLGESQANIKEIMKRYLLIGQIYYNNNSIFRMIQQGYVLRKKTNKVDTNELAVYALHWGPKADLEIGRR